eukprot:TRINITY_DN12027_c0_g2_i1.p1 TRINITY_DN12027_c0_g2~~TRINITY_DN12027_c0_g2_i1.p1  ORF type:complete len:105 (+),score=24.83 TRINITY_DN12027_c0_g2_i1:58-372(+)
MALMSIFFLLSDLSIFSNHEVSEQQKNAVGIGIVLMVCTTIVLVVLLRLPEVLMCTFDAKLRKFYKMHFHVVNAADPTVQDPQQLRQNVGTLEVTKAVIVDSNT